jgi:hypothetical protein
MRFDTATTISPVSAKLWDVRFGEGRESPAYTSSLRVSASRNAPV